MDLEEANSRGISQARMELEQAPSDLGSSINVQRSSVASKHSSEIPAKTEASPGLCGGKHELSTDSDMQWARPNTGMPTFPGKVESATTMPEGAFKNVVDVGVKLGAFGVGLFASLVGRNRLEIIGGGRANKRGGGVDRDQEDSSLSLVKWE